MLLSRQQDAYSTTEAPLHDQDNCSDPAGAHRDTHAPGMRGAPHERLSPESVRQEVNEAVGWVSKFPESSEPLCALLLHL